MFLSRRKHDEDTGERGRKVKMATESDLANAIAVVRHGQDVTASDLANRLMPWLNALIAEKRAEWEAEQGTEEPEWTEERVEEARIHYRYGVNSGTLNALNTPASIASVIEREEQRTMGPIGAHKVETRTKITRTSPWVPVEQGELT